MKNLLQETTLDTWHIAIAKKDSFSSKDVVFPRLVHGGEIIRANECISGETIADGIVVDIPDIRVGVDTADCMPLVLLSTQQGLALHVSRKSLIHGLLDTVPEYISPRNITHVLIGPHICPTHFTFEFEGEELLQFKKLFPHAVEEQHDIHLSLLRAVQGYFDAWNIPKESIVHDGRCTFEDAKLSSYRRRLASGKEEDRYPGIATVIWRE